MRDALLIREPGSNPTGREAVAVVGAEVVVIPYVDQRHIRVECTLHARAEYFAVRLPKKRAIILVDIAVVQIADLQKKKRIAPEDSPEHLMLGAGPRA